jgi:hypothetical protein
VKARPASQKAVLAFHVTAGAVDLKSHSARLVNPDLVAGSEFCGVSLHRGDGALLIDKSLKHSNAAFVRIERVHRSDALFSEVATMLYDDETAALRNGARNCRNDGRTVSFGSACSRRLF